MTRKPFRMVQFSIDPDPDFSDLEQWDTPEKYAGNEVYACDRHPFAGLRGRKVPRCKQCNARVHALSFDDYRATFGNPENYHMLSMLTYEQQPDATWHLVDSLHGIEFFTSGNHYQLGKFFYTCELFEPYQRQLARDAGLPYKPTAADQRRLAAMRITRKLRQSILECAVDGDAFAWNHCTCTMGQYSTGRFARDCPMHSQ